MTDPGPEFDFPFSLSLLDTLPNDGPDIMDMPLSEALGVSAASFEGANTAAAASFTPLETDFDTHYGLLSPASTVLIRAYSDDTDDRMLDELKPRFVVMFEPCMEFVRRIEVSDRVLSILVGFELALFFLRLRSRLLLGLTSTPRSTNLLTQV